jgi:hypothetical protein
VGAADIPVTMLGHFLLVVACRRLCDSKSLLSDVVVYLHDEELDGWRSIFGRNFRYRYLLFRVCYDSLSCRQKLSRIVLWLAWTARFFLVLSPLAQQEAGGTSSASYVIVEAPPLTRMQMETT